MFSPVCIFRVVGGTMVFKLLIKSSVSISFSKDDDVVVQGNAYDAC